MPVLLLLKCHGSLLLLLFAVALLKAEYLKEIESRARKVFQELAAAQQ